MSSRLVSGLLTAVFVVCGMGCGRSATEAPSTEAPSTEAPSTEAPSPSTGTPSTGTPSTEVDPPLKPLSLLVSEQPLALEAPTSIALQLLVLGAGDSPVTFFSSNLPAFADLSGAVLRLSPGYGDAGDHEIALTATAGGRTASAMLRLHITRSNTPPMWGPEPLLAPAESKGPVDSLSTTYIRTIKYTPTLWVPMFDKESDDVTVEVEVIPVEQTGLGPHVATHSQTLSLKGIPRPPYASPDWQPEINFKIPLTGLTPSVTYRLSLRAYDSLGAEDPYSWVEMGDFTIAP